MVFFENTLYWYQILNTNPNKLETLKAECRAAIQWLVANKLLDDADGAFVITPLGNAAALSGLLPGTAVQLASLLTKLIPDLSKSFDQSIPGLIYAVCACEEFRSKRPSRFFPFVQGSYNSVTFLASKNLPIALDRTDLQLAQCAHAMILYVEGLAERKIAFATKVGSGAIHRLAIDVAWVTDGLHKLTSVPDLNCPQTVANEISMLARRVRLGAPVEALDIMRVAERHGVPGLADSVRCH